MKPFRFGVQLQQLPPDGWVERVRSIEELGYSSVFFPDHFSTQWDPTTALAAIAAWMGSRSSASSAAWSRFHES